MRDIEKSLEQFAEKGGTDVEEDVENLLIFSKHGLTQVFMIKKQC